jgi:hypothetical protein
MAVRAGLAPFALAQALAAWCWYCLHAKRARDAGEDTLAALAVAGLYALASSSLCSCSRWSPIHSPAMQPALLQQGLRISSSGCLCLPC